MTDAATLTLRPAVPSDAAAIAALFTDEGYPAGPSDIVTRLARFEPPQAHGSSSLSTRARSSASSLSSRCRGSSTTTGSCASSRSSSTPVPASAGVGKTLLAEADRIGREMGAAFVELTAGHHRPEARHLYESVGYDATVTAYLRKKL